MQKRIFILVMVLLMPLSAAAKFDKDLFFGLRNDSAVSELQRFLTAQNVYSGPVTGNFGPLTREGIKRFQEKEAIKPAAGYFGSKSRTRANSILAAVPTKTKVEIAAEIRRLQDQLRSIQEGVKAPSALATSTEIVISKPQFITSPYVSESGFLTTDFRFGVHYPYWIKFNWATDVKGAVEESVSCSPSLKVSKPQGKLTKYFAEPHADYNCTVTVTDSSGSSAVSAFSFSTPNWVSVYGVAALSFPGVFTTPLKIGEFSVYNGTTTDVLFAGFETEISDEMDSTFNRGRKVYFLLRSGKNADDTLISKTEFTFVTNPPKTGEPYKVRINIPYDVLLKSGEEKNVSLWIEQLEYVKSGTLEIKSTKTSLTTPLTVTGSFDFVLTKQAGL